MSNAENNPYPLPVHFEMSQPTNQLRPAVEIAGAREVARKGFEFWEKEKLAHSIDGKWLTNLNHPKWTNAPEIVKQGISSNKLIAQRDALSFALGGNEGMYFSSIDPYIKIESEGVTVGNDISLRSLDEVIGAKTVITEKINSSPEVETAIETFRLYTVDLQSEGSVDNLMKVAKILRAEQEKGRMEAFDYVMGNENVITHIISKRK